jgi:adenylate cyclase, class 2
VRRAGVPIVQAETASMTYEVEMKFPLGEGDDLVPRLLALGAVEHETLEQADRYFNHPSHDFAETDEAFRLRSIGDENCVTYKGPKLDPVAKTRHEIEIAYASGLENAVQFAEMLTLLGFRESLTVRKTRRVFHLKWKERSVEVLLDRVAQLGDFAEIETLSNDDEKEVAKECVLSLAAELGLEKSERRSYLRMLIEHSSS